MAKFDIWKLLNKIISDIVIFVNLLRRILQKLGTYVDYATNCNL